MNKRDFIKNLTLITQLGFSICTPIILCILGAGYLQKKFQLGAWIIIIGVVLGVGGGMMSMMKSISYLEYMQKNDKKKKENHKGK